MLTRCTRRPWIWTLAPLVLVLLVACPGGGGENGDTATTEPPPPTTEQTTDVHTRPEINTLSASQVDAYRKGVALMQSRGPDDPTSWTYQANMHGYPTNNSICQVTPGAPQPAWSTCQHGSFFFLAWHRMYLHYFERILRTAVQEATNDPTYEFSLPFWDYENPDNHDLPEALRNPANSSNPLWVAQRTASCNNGSECVSAEEASDEVAMTLIPFCSCDGDDCGGCQTGISSDESFGGGFTAAPNHNGSGPGELELQPHGVVHDAVGGPTGWMSYFTCAARDPVFWLHHANIDRLWQVWLNQGGGRINPLGSDEWKTQQFTFFDEHGQAVQMTGCQILNTATQLDYQYAGVPVTNVTLCDDAAPPTAAPPAPPAPPKTLASAPAQTRLGRTAVSLKVAVPRPAGDRMLAVAGPEPGHLRLVIEGLKLVQPGVHFQVFMNLPEGATPDPKGPHFVGHLALFTDHEHQAEGVTRSFDITNQVQELRQAGQWSADLRLTFVPAHEAPTLAAAPGGAGGSFLSFSRVAIVERP